MHCRGRGDVIQVIAVLIDANSASANAGAQQLPALPLRACACMCTAELVPSSSAIIITAQKRPARTGYSTVAPVGI